MPQAILVLELGVGVRAVEIPPPFDILRYEVHHTAAAGGGEPLSIRSEAPPWFEIVSFPVEDHAFDTTADANAFAWVTRVETELIGGSATLSYTTRDRRHHSAQVALGPDRTRYDLLLEKKEEGAWLMLRRGEGPGAAEARIRGVRGFRLIDEEGGVLRA